MRSSEDTPQEADMTDEIREIPSIDDVRAMLPRQSALTYWLRRIDIPVQLGRLAFLFLIWWLWWSETIWDGWDSFTIFGITPFPNVPPTFRAAPGDTWDYLKGIVDDRLFWENTWVTLKEALISLLLGSVLGLVVGLVLGRFTRVAKIFGPFLVLFNAMPKIAFLPLILVVYGVGEMSKVVLATIIVFFIIEIPTQSAVALVDPDLDKVARTMGASQLQRFTKVTLPGILPAVFGALRLGAVIAVQASIFGEFFSARRGLGQLVQTSANQLQYDQLFGIVFVLALIALLLNGVIGAAERYFLRWRADDSSSQVVSL